MLVFHPPLANALHPAHFRLLFAGMGACEPGRVAFDTADLPEAVEMLWICTFAGRVNVRRAENVRVLGAGQVMILSRSSGASFTVPKSPHPWEYVFLAAGRGSAAEGFQFLSRKFGTFQRMGVESRVVRAAKKIAERAATLKGRPAHDWALEGYTWLHLWWETCEKEGTSVSKSLTWKPGEMSRRSASTLQELAHDVGYSTSHLSRKLYKEWGEPPGRALRNCRLDEAARQLRAGTLPVSSIGAFAGYDSTSAFCRAFKARFGITPTKYRQNRPARSGGRSKGG